AETNNSELELAESLVNNMRTSFEEIDTVDHFHRALKAMLETKVAGGTIEIKPAASITRPVVSIMDALQASLKAKEAQSHTNQLQQPDAPTLALVPDTPVQART